MEKAPVKIIQRVLREQGVHGWLQMVRSYGASYWVQGAVVSSDPEVVQALLMDRAHAVHRAEPYKLMEKIIPGAPGILFKDGVEWATRLRVLMPSFTPSRIDSLAGEILEAAGTHVREMVQEVRQPDLALAISYLGARTVMQAGYNLDPDHPASRRFTEELVAYKFATMTLDDRRRLDEVGFRWTKIRHLPWGILHHFDLRKRIQRLHAIVDELVRDLPIWDRSRKGWIELLQEGGFSGATLVNELNHLYGAYNAVDYVVACALVEMDRNPEVASRVRAELVERGEAGGAFSFHELDHLPETRTFILEVLRCYPVAMLVFRETGAPLQIGDETVPAGTLAMIPIYALHHASDRWNSPDQFNPGRWLEGKGRNQRYSYVPFLDGSRKCIGQRLAETQILAALFALRHHRVVIEAEGLKVNHYIVPRWDRPIPFRIEKAFPDS